MLIKKSTGIQLSYEVSGDEKKRAEKLIMAIDLAITSLRSCDDHLNIMYTPFKNNPSVSTEEVFKYRAALRRYRDESIKNFNEFKKIAFRCYVLMNKFTPDTQMVKLIKSFTMSVSDIEKQVNIFAGAFDDLEVKDFPILLTKCIDNIKKEVAQLKQILEDRVKPHIQNNILARNWVDTISNTLQEKIEEKIPLTVKLVNERNELINSEKKQ
jgi:hypothetical protein